MKFLHPEINILSNFIANNLFNTWISLRDKKDYELVKLTGFLIYHSALSHINRFSSHKKNEKEKETCLTVAEQKLGIFVK